jgi:L,D-transpeptidase YcbB
LLLAGLLFLALGTCGAPFRRSSTRLLAAETPRCGSAADFYAAHPGAALWVRNGRLTARGRELASLLAGASAEGLDLARYRVPAGDERSLSAAFVRYVNDLTRAPAGNQVYYVDTGLKRAPPCASRLLEGAAASTSLSKLIHPVAEPNLVARTIRTELAPTHDPGTRAAISKDLGLARSLGSPKRLVLVDTSRQRLWMIDGDRVAGSMKVVVGKAGMDTPQMAALIRYAVVNPYWYIPPDVVQHEVAAHVVAAGADYLTSHDYEPVTSYDGSGVSVDATAINWTAVRNGSAKVGIRQLPGPDNMMGRVMFMFPNRLGIYLHDTPVRWVFGRQDRRLSHGCVRLEHADALYKWLFGQPLVADEMAGADQQVGLPDPVPVYLVRFHSGAWTG